MHLRMEHTRVGREVRHPPSTAVVAKHNTCSPGGGQHLCCVFGWLEGLSNRCSPASIFLSPVANLVVYCHKGPLSRHPEEPWADGQRAVHRRPTCGTTLVARMVNAVGGYVPWKWGGRGGKRLPTLPQTFVLLRHACCPPRNGYNTHCLHPTQPACAMHRRVLVGRAWLSRCLLRARGARLPTIESLRRNCRSTTRTSPCTSSTRHWLPA